MKKLLGLLYVLLGAFVIVLYLASPFIDGDTVFTVWAAIDPVFAVAAVLAVIVGVVRRLSLDDGGPGTVVTREWLSSSVLIWLGLTVSLWLTWNWASLLWGPEGSSLPWLWTVLDGTLPVLFFLTATHLLDNDK